ncbi:MAG: alanine dehydrogenase [Anaerolineae bacterium]|jgi:alanine dehydrogenase|nr:alanine dehydrogenase [Chloroflexota bacterium]
MQISVPTEIMDRESRVALTPAGVDALVHAGNQVRIQRGAGQASGFDDAEYAAFGAELVDTAAEAWNAELVLKVKEPRPEEYDLMQSGQTLFTYLHLASSESLTDELLARKIDTIGYETVQRDDRALPLLSPMSEIAGRMVVQIGAHFLEKQQGGRGVLLGGVPGVSPGNVVIIGGGAVGTNAARVALGLGANVTVIDLNLERLRYLDETLEGRLTTLASNRRNIYDAARQADVLIGSVLIPGARTPVLVTREMVADMAPGSVALDIAVDQGGCIETIHPTSHTNPTYVEYGVVHYGVPNVPAAVPRTSTLALCNATLPYVQNLARWGVVDAIKRDRALARGVNTFRGELVYGAVAEAFGRPAASLEQLLAG